MTCRPWRWLWGLLPLALILVLIHLGESSRVERELTARAHNALEASGLNWAQAEFNGRDGIISGTAANDEQRNKALTIVQNLRGVRRVADRATLQKHVKSYFWLARREENRLKLIGFIPDEAARNAVMGMVKAIFPGLEINDRTEFARGSPPQDVWLSGVSFGLKQLGRLEEGQISLLGTSFDIRGRAQDIDSYRALKFDLLNSAMPTGIILKSHELLPPRIKPFPWLATLNGKELVVTGYSPSENFQEAFKKRARSLLPGFIIVDRTQIADGEPGGWLIAAYAAIKLFPQLRSGKISFIGEELSVFGTVDSESAAADISEYLRNTVPSRFNITTDLETIAVVPKDIAPYRWSAIRKGSLLKLLGYVPNETSRRQIVDFAEAHLPGVTVDEQLQLAQGAPSDQQVWQEGLKFALKQLEAMSEGTAELTDLSLRLRGRSRDHASYGKLKRVLGTGGPEGIRLVQNKIAPPFVSPYRWRARLTRDGLEFAGFVPDEETRRHLLQLAKSRFTGLQVTDRLAVTDGNFDRARWFPAVRTAIDLLTNLTKGEARLVDLNLEIEGLASDSGTFQVVEEQLTSRFPAGVTLVSSNILPPKISPYRLSVMVGEREVLLTGHLPDGSARAVILEEAQQQFRDMRITEQLTLASGHIGSRDEWLSTVRIGLATLAKLGNGKAELIDETLSLEGRADSVSERRSVEAALKNRLLPGFRSIMKIDVKETDRRLLSWRADVKGDRVELMGSVQSETTKRALLSLARTSFPGRMVIDRMELTGFTMKDWHKACETALVLMAKLGNGQAILTGKHLRLLASASDRDIANEVHIGLQSGLPTGYKGYGEKITVAEKQPNPTRDVGSKFSELKPPTTGDDAREPSAKIPKETIKPPRPIHIRKEKAVQYTVLQKSGSRMQKKAPSDTPVPEVAKVTPRECEALLSSISKKNRINFRKDSTILLPGNFPTLVRLTYVVKRCPNTEIEISGHTDSDGGEEFNMELSKRRVETVVNFLLGRGVESSRLRAVGFGEKRPLVPNTSSNNKAKNRRIEFDIRLR